jgi:hypothetical protein
MRLKRGKSGSRRKRGWSLENGALALQHALLHGCGFYWFIDRPETRRQARLGTWDSRRAKWVVAWSLVLIGLWAYTPAPLGLRLVAGGLAVWRLFEISVTGLGSALGEKAQVKARNLVTIGFYGMQLVLIFAICYHSFAVGHLVAKDTGVTDGHIASSDYLYVAWANFTSLGTEAYVAKGDGMRFMEVVTTTAGILLLGVLLAFGIDQVKDGEGDPPGPTAKEAGATTD